MSLGRLLVEVPAISQASYIDGAGRERARVVRDGNFVRENILGEDGQNLAFEPPFTATRGGEPYYSPVTLRGDEPRFTTSVIADTSRGVVTVDVDLKAVREVIAKARFGRAGHVYALDARDHIIAHSDPGIDLAETDFSKLPQVQAARFSRPPAEGATPMIVTNAKGQQVLSAFSTIQPVGWTVFVEQPVEEAFAPLGAFLARTGIILFAGLGMAGFASYHLARRLANPIQTLRTGALRLGAGDLDQRIEINTGDELEALAGEFNHMADQLQDSYATLERRVEERTQELSEALVELAAARDQALDASRAKSAFLASMSHELRTPLNAIIGFTEVLTDPDMPVDEATQSEFLQDVLAAGRHLLALINDILDLSKVEAGKMEFFPEEFDLATAIHGVEAVAKSLTERKHQRLDVEIEPGLTTVYHDPARFKQVLFNLVSNAVKFTPDGGSLRVSAARDDSGWLEVAVSDNGIGIKQEDQALIFEEFRQVDSGYGRQQLGTGLGLALVRRFVQTMGGDISVQSEVGKGSTFTFRIPLRQREFSSPAAGQSPVVLVVEDNPQASALLDFHLTRGGYRVERAPDIRLAWESIARVRPAAITLDIQLPNPPDGWELLKRLKQDPTTRDIPVVVVSITDEPGMAHQLGAAGQLVKPVDPRALLETIGRVTQPEAVAV